MMSTGRTLAVTALVLCLTMLLPGDASARSRIAMGMSVDPGIAADMDVVDQMIARTGATPAVWSLWSSWGGRGGQTACTPSKGDCAFPKQAAAGLKARGITPMIWWVPTDRSNPQAGKFERYVRIINGRHDAYIRQFARDVKAHGGPVVIRFAHEPNGNWYWWGLRQFDNTPWRYKAAWRHIWRIFRDVGASNARFLWNPIGEYCNGCWPHIKYERFYPGNKYVDYVGVSAFNWGRGRWKSMVNLLNQKMLRMRQVTRSKSLPNGKPVIIGELASNHIGGDKGNWIRYGYGKSYHRWPQLKGIVYLNTDMRPAGQPDWRLLRPANGSAWRAYSKIAAQPRFRGKIK